MCTKLETVVITTSITEVKLSKRKAQKTSKLDVFIQLDRITFATVSSAKEKNIPQEKMQEIISKTVVKIITSFSPSHLCEKPAIAAPSKGKNTTKNIIKAILSWS